MQIIDTNIAFCYYTLCQRKYHRGNDAQTLVMNIKMNKYILVDILCFLYKFMYYFAESIGRIEFDVMGRIKWDISTGCLEGYSWVHDCKGRNRSFHSYANVSKL